MYIANIDSSMLKAIIESIRTILIKCKELDALCYDTPATTTHLMQCMGFNEYFIRKTWRVFEEINGLRINMYKFHDVEFDLLFEHRKEPVPRLRDSCIPVDDEVCYKKRSECITSPHIHSLYIYLEGKLGRGGYVKINVVRLLRLLQMKDEKLTYELLDVIEKLLTGKGSIRKLYILVLKILLKNRGVLSLILPMVPQDLEGLFKASPFARLIRLHTDV